MVIRQNGVKPTDIFLMITVVGILLTVMCITMSQHQEVKRSTRLSPQQKRDIRGAELAGISANSYVSEVDTCNLHGLDRIMVERVPGTPGNRAVRDYLVKRLEDLGWLVEFDTFQQDTVIGKVEFSNVIGTSNPVAESHVVITAHYDSKIFPPQPDGSVFVAAIDSAVPCAMILNMLDNLNNLLQKRHNQDPTRGIKVVFFDGEEAFKEWSSDDSIYGSTHIAEKWYQEGFFHHIETFVLLDLIGGANPTFKSSFEETQHHFKRLSELENELERFSLLSPGRQYFRGFGRIWGIEDDHKPFLDRGLKRIVHLIPTPFPPQWHQITDDGEHLDCPTIHHVQAVIQTWIAELFSLHKMINM